ncbi:sugar transferase [Agromyces larvae]|uniref:Sugar transferase n=1 Tax=Agromyces larvae TaxID=2929802 RepID=A0ABY4BU50_9MICO|nr:sugar transferase [Agromyces larvae]UOE42743.1 sugar transferase [Agromyces larvae]
MSVISNGFAEFEPRRSGLAGLDEASTRTRTRRQRERRADVHRRRLITSDLAVVLIAVAAGVAVPVPQAAVAAASATVNGVSVVSVAAAALIVVGWLALLTAMRSRDPRVLGIGVTEYKRVANATLLAFGVLATVCALAPIPDSRGLLLVALPFGLLLLLLERWLWRKRLFVDRAAGRYLSRAIVVGHEDDVRYVVETIGQSCGPLFSVEGVVLDRSDGTGGSVRVGSRIIPVIGELADAAAAAARVGAESVIVAGQPSGGSNYIRSLAWSLEPIGSELVLSSRLVDVAGPRIHFRPVEGLPLIHVETPRFEGGKHVLKRGFDILAAGFGLLLITPLLLVIAAGIKLDDGGPVLFRQRRIGRNGETFEMLKFRSMVTDAEARLATLQARNDGSGPLFKLKDDPRITRIGAFLRSHSLDELPQLWNVVRGDMSMVGPRPPLPSEVAEYTSDVHRRLYIKPGLTGLWQVGGRSDLSWEEGVRLDLYYVENWSLTGDLMLIWRTLKVVFHPEGAY